MCLYVVIDRWGRKSMTEPEDVKYPQGADRRALESGHARTIEEHERLFAAAHDKFLRHSEHKAGALNVSLGLLGVSPEQVEGAAAEQYAAGRDYVRGIHLAPEPPPSGHNPVRYAPYDFSWSGINCGGINACKTYGPDRVTGEIGADLFSSTAGGGSSGVYVGDWFYSQSEDTWSVSVQAYVWGVGYVASAFGYAAAYAGLQLFVRDHSNGNTYTTTTDIYNKSADGFGFDITEFDSTTVSVLSYIPVHANTWYEVWGGAVQHAYAGGIVADAVSNFDMYVSPIAASGIVIF
jgi:hypothetical protein